MSFSAKILAVDPDGAQESHALEVTDAAFGLLAVQVGPPSGVGVLVAASEPQFLYLLAGVIEWGMDSDIPPAAIMATVRKAMAHNASSRVAREAGLE